MNYPYNHLRNVALGQVGAKYVFLTDIDFLPSLNLYSTLKAELFSNDTNAQKNKALIIPGTWKIWNYNNKSHLQSVIIAKEVS